MGKTGGAKNLKPWKPGESGNPGGRPKGFAAKIKDLCGDDYEQIAEGFWTIAFGTPAAQKRFFGEAVKVTARDRIHAMVELRDSGPGRPAQTIHADLPAVPLFKLPDGVMPNVTREPQGQE